MQPSEWHAKYNGNDAGICLDEPKCIEASDQKHLHSLWGILKDTADILEKNAVVCIAVRFVCAFQWRNVIFVSCQKSCLHPIELI